MTRRRGVDQLASLHGRAKAGELTPEQRDEYQVLRDAFVAAMLDAQNACLAEGQKRRQTVRIRRAIQVDLAWQASTARTVTFDVGLGGFSALLADPPPPEALVRVRLRLPGGRNADALAAVVGAHRRQRAFHASFAFRRQVGDWRAFEDLVLDHLLADVACGAGGVSAESLSDWLREAG
jgi:hypothetical protein